MRYGNTPTTLRARKLVIGFISSWLLWASCAEVAHAIPTFSRKYGTSCITCHAGFPKLNSVGEAFRRNGYQFPSDDESLVKDEAIPLGNDRYKDMWPNSIWPNDIPHLPPIALRTTMAFNQFLDRQPRDAPTSDFQFPREFGLLSAGTLGKNISWFAGMTLAGKEEDAAGLGPDLERLFVQFSNLFAWSDEDDDDGMRLGNRWLAVPKHLINLRVGQFEPQVVAPYASIHRRLSTTVRLPNVASVGGNAFTLEPAQRGIELHGIWRQYNSYAVGLVNGNGAENAWDNNSQKDFYFRVSRKWWGFPLDGVLSQFDLADNSGPDPEPPGENETAPMGLDFWREFQFETGIFGYFGRNQASVTTVEDVMVPVIGGSPLDLMRSTTFTRPDRFERVGFDARLQRQDLDIFGSWTYGWNKDPISAADPLSMSSEQMQTWFVEADYYFKPWLIGYSRYEGLHFNNDVRQSSAGIQRAVIGSAAYIRTNVRLVNEFVIDAQGNGTTGNTFNALLDFAY